MAEELVLTDPIVKPAETTSRFKIMSILFDRILRPVPSQPAGFVSVTVEDETGKRLVCTYEGQAALDYIKFANTANFSVNSMQKRTLQKLSADGKLPPGNVEGAPDP